ncbi:hypothetical protein M3Y99_00718600 [Aphelenchoides fujianensis]|nr:hypothetical protein M3Y99_00718600 [Aphelenchoides fujianensis]
MIDTKRPELRTWTSTKHKRPLKLRKFGEPFWEAEAAVNNFKENVGLCSIDPFAWDEDDVCKWFYALIDGDLPEDFDVDRYTPQKLSGMSREEWAELPNGRSPSLGVKKRST